MDGVYLQAGERLLYGCLRPVDGDRAIFEELKEMSPEEWQGLLELAGELGVTPILAARLCSSPLTSAVPDEVKRVLATERRRLTLANLRLHADLNRVVVALHQHRIPVIVLKGLHLATLVYGDVAIRRIRDIDVLVRAGDLSSADEALRALGYAPVNRYHLSAEGPYEQKHLPRFLKSGATDVEVHWHVAESDFREYLDINELWDRAVAVRIAGVDVHVLSPEDLLLHLCIHATRVHLCEFSTQPWCDIAATIQKYSSSLSWAEIVARATRWRCRRGTYLALRLARQQMGAAVPHEVLHQLRPAGFDEEILTIAVRQCHRFRIPTAAASLQAAQNVVGRLQVLWRCIFVPTREIADRYNLSRSSWFLYAYYAIRAKDLAKHHWQMVLRLHRGDPALITVIQETEALQTFVAAE